MTTTELLQRIAAKDPRYLKHLSAEEAAAVVSDDAPPAARTRVTLPVMEKCDRLGEQLPGPCGAVLYRCDHFGDKTTRFGGCVDAQRSCADCPEHPVRRHAIRPAPVVFPPATTRHLLFHIYPVGGNGAWQWNVDELCQRLHLFNGRRVVAIVTDPPEGRKADPKGPHPPDGERALAACDTPAAVRARFGRHAAGIEFIEVGNDPHLREVATFEALFSRVAEFVGPGDVTLYAQAKGTTRPPGHLARRWTAVLYETLLDHWPVVEDGLARHPVTGSFQKCGETWPTQYTGSQWHYSGSWFWVRNRELFAKDWRRIDRFWSGIEPYPSVHFGDEAGCVFLKDGARSMDLYDQAYWSRVVEPALAQFRDANVSRRTEPPRINPAPHPLLSPDAFAHVFAPLAGKRVGWVPTPGNAGDHLIEAATFQLLAHFGVSWTVGTDPTADVLLVPGGGSMGTPHYHLCRNARLLALSAGPPVWVLPQSWYGPDEDAGRFAKLFARDAVSQSLAPGSILAPDLALGLSVAGLPEPDRERGVWLRKDIEALFAGRESDGDPVRAVAASENPGWEYLALAARYEEIVTDRLHFAIAGLLASRKVTLLPNHYHKNRACWEAWLRDLGCAWGDEP